MPDIILAKKSDITTLNADVNTEGSVLKSIKDNAENATYDNSTSGLTADTLGGVIDEVGGRIDDVENDIDAIKGTGWDGENLSEQGARIDDVENDIDAIKGTDWTDETVKGNAEDIATLNSDDSTDGSVAKTVKDAVEPIIEDVSSIGITLSNHTGDTENPHAVTKAQVGLANADNTSDTDKPVSTAQQAELDLKIPLAQKAAANGIATLGSDGKIPSAQIPSIALVDVFTVADEAAMLSSGAEQGDMAIRSDVNQAFILAASPASTLSNWVELSGLKALVDAHAALTDNPHSVTKAQVGLGSVDNTSDTSKPVSTLQQVALDLKLNKSDVVDNLTTDDASKALSAKQGKTLSEQLFSLDERVIFIEHRSKLTTWAEVQDAAKNGLASRYLKVGNLVETSYGGSPAVVELIGINHPFDIPPVGVEYGDVLSWGFKDCLQNAQYSAPQALFNAVEGLDAGSYTFINSNDSLPYTFTIAQALPAGGVIVITSWGVGAYEPTVLKTMQADRLTNIETGVAVTQASGGTALAPVNLTPRCRYGANLYIESGIRHFLNDNSDSYVWVAQGLYDMPSTYGAGGGFLKRLDADFASVIGPVVKKVARATADGGGQDTTEDKVWLLSRVEMGYGTEGVTTGEQVYERWNGATNAERIKLLSGSPRYWWLRPPVVSSQIIARLVNTDGTLNYYYSNVSFGLAPGLAVY